MKKKRKNKRAEIDHDAFVSALREQFPEIAHPLRDSLIDSPDSMAMSDFCRFTQDAIDRGDRELVKRCFRFADMLSDEGDWDVQNAVGVAYIEHLDFSGPKREYARDLMSSPMRITWFALTEYMNQIDSDDEE
jgi:arginine deiminase